MDIMVVLNIPAKFRSSLHSIQLAALGKNSDLKLFGYEKFLEPLINDILSLENKVFFLKFRQVFKENCLLCMCR